MPICDSCGRECKHRFCTRKCAALYGAVQSRKGKTTDIERKIEEFLRDQNIVYEKNKAVARTSVPDFIIGKLCVYADGDYWHRTKKAQYRDKKIDAKLTKLGYTVIRFSGTTINTNFNIVADTIKTSICQQPARSKNAS